MSCIITVYNVFKTAMKLKLKITVAYYEAKPNLFTHLLDSARSSLLLWVIVIATVPIPQTSQLDSRPMQSCIFLTTSTIQAWQFYMGFLPMAGPPRFELGTAESKSAELPLLHGPINSVYFAFLYSVCRMPHIYYNSQRVELRSRW